MVSVQIAFGQLNEDGASSSDSSDTTTGASTYWLRQYCSGRKRVPDQKVLWRQRKDEKKRRRKREEARRNKLETEAKYTFKQNMEVTEGWRSM